QSPVRLAVNRSGCTGGMRTRAMRTDLHALGRALVATGALAQPSTDARPPKHVEFSFEGPLGTYDRGALQRGFQVYKEVCSACHSLNRVAFHNLSEPGGPGFTEAQVKALAASYKIPAEPNDKG